jgi:excinuclease ABC subunit B
MKGIKSELKDRLSYYNNNKKLLEAQRIAQRTEFDLEMIAAQGFCTGIENYSRYLTGRAPGEPPPTLFEYLPENAILFTDESHVTVPQIGAMSKGDFSRKSTLSEHGFRLPSCVDNRPLKFEEWDAMRPQTVHVSATPGKWEMQQTQGIFTEQVIRPTGLIDPPVEIRPVSTNGASQVDDVIHEVKEVAGRGFRSLITTLTKKMAEDLTDYMHDQSIRVRYMHSDIDTLERIEIIRDLRLGKFDVLVGINLLREGLDIPECAFVGILDADKEGFLRSETSLVQTIGRAARNSEARVVLYGDRVTGSMQRAIDETDRRRARQVKHNELNNITPKTVLRGVADTVGDSQDAQRIKDEANRFTPTGQIKKKFIENSSDFRGGDNIITVMADIEKQMFKAAENLEFEKAAELRDELERLKSNS